MIQIFWGLILVHQLNGNWIYVVLDQNKKKYSSKQYDIRLTKSEYYFF